MHLDELLNHIAAGEYSRRQFKKDIHNSDALAAEMAAFANSQGGLILIGIADDGSLPGLSSTEVARINQLISNTASQSVRSPITVTSENILLDNGQVVIALTVPSGIDKPYFDKNGVIWLKCGADKRRIQSKEELRRLFQSVDQFHADELPTSAGLEQLDKVRLQEFVDATYSLELPSDPSMLWQLLQNMNLATDNEKLNLAGVLLFAKKPEWIKPQFTVKAIHYPGTDFHSSTYVDSEECTGPLSKIFDSAMFFINRNLPKRQSGPSINSLGRLEIPAFVFEEILVNALVHRDYLIDAPIRLFIFENRIEIISPGHLPNHLTVAKVLAGNTNIRNPILASYVAKGILPYRGLGSGIQRALKGWPQIELIDDREGASFRVILPRPTANFKS